MNKYWFLCLIFFSLVRYEVNADVEKVWYQLTDAPIDVIIPCASKDVSTLDACIQGIRRNGRNINRIIVVSDKKCTYAAEWFDESAFPFSKFDVALAIFGDERRAREFQCQPNSRLGWIYQQLIKLYATKVIPNISPNVLVLDADTIFLNPVTFVGPNGGALFTRAWQYHDPYFKHASKLIPWLRRVHPDKSGICNYMLFQRAVIDDLLKTIEGFHHDVAWKSICRCIDHGEVHHASLSEFEIYFNFALLRTDQMKVVELKWTDISSVNQVPSLAAQGYHFVSCHTYMRK